MKNVLFSLAICLTALPCVSQEFAPIGATWVYSKFCLSDPLCGYDVFTSVGDTMVNLQNCRKIKYTSIGGEGFSQPDTTYILYSQGNSVYIYDIIFDKFVKTYEYNKAVGDTIILVSTTDTNSLYQIGTEFSVVVDSISYINGGSNFLEVQYTHPTMSSNYFYHTANIFLIGNLMRFIPGIEGIPLGGYLGVLLCYNDNNNSFGQGSYCITDLQEQINKRNFGVHPTVFSGLLNITGEISKPNSLTIHDYLGNIVFKGHLTQTDNFIDLSFLNNGLYFLSYTDGFTKNKKLKIIKQ